MLLLRQALWGCYRPVNVPERALPFEVELRARHVERLLSGRVIGLEGWVSARELTARSPLGGTLWLGGPGVVHYEIAFDDERGGSCWLRAAVRFDHRRPFFSLSRLCGTLTPARGALARVELRYDYRRDCRGLFSFHLQEGGERWND